MSTAALLVIAVCGCGTTKSRLATEQLLMSDAVDRAVEELDFRPLAGRKVFLNSRYAQNIQATTFVNADYITSSVRQQMLAAGCCLQDKEETADVIAELRIGTLGTDGSDMVYGIPASRAVSTAASFVPSVPAVPQIPEISVGRKEIQLGAAKIALFAYDRTTQRPVWQSGIRTARSTAQDVWIFSAGPFQKGTIYDGTQLAGTSLRMPGLKAERTFDEDSPVPYDREYLFEAPKGSAEPSRLLLTGSLSELPPAEKPPAKSETAAPAPAPVSTLTAPPAPSATPNATPAPAAAPVPGDNVKNAPPRQGPGKGKKDSDHGEQAHITDRKQ